MNQLWSFRVTAFGSSLSISLTCLTFAVAALVWAPSAAAADDSGWLSAGVRGGVDDRINRGDFRQFEAFSRWSLPWSHRWPSGWTVIAALEVTAGLIEGEGDSGFVGSVGPGIRLTAPNQRLDLSFGVNPTYLSRHTFGDVELGGPIGFTTHVDADLHLGSRWIVGCRWQHMSNANIYPNNPGVNHIMIAVGYRIR